MPLPTTDDYRRIVLESRPLIDVRAPVEFAKGAFPGAVNLPLMSDEERHLVGKMYKEEGNEAAVALGHRLVSGGVKARRIQAWCSFVKTHPDALLYCFRGGLRSQIAQAWMAEAGCDIVRIEGGYKAFRRYLIEEMERSEARFSPLVLAGRTGSGKTILLRTLPDAVDLEALANHRGSSFGRKITPQPTQIDFENALAYAIIKKLATGWKRLVFEDEGKNVGRLYLPRKLYEHLAKAPLVVLKTSMERRVAITFEEYVVRAQEGYALHRFEDPLKRWYEDIEKAIGRIQKRLGGERCKEVLQMLRNAYREQIASGRVEAHKTWVEYLLREYYDPMYDYQIQKRRERILFRGDWEEVKAFLGDGTHCTTSF
ncbi:tRNA 2-selenouridine(34) synthase MnmH [Hydrogenimonas urashimensis]|uniref:tRNA 2-selenouridine(34) synthase MnmH n=1 Tax=Hydrogenimonas urashimensis TaxID=2740515 RepID=UPI001F47EA21|nr:tRNA 2-selenouridine(34) synthase MnmH [Hydrogenimonas urashimensis]